MSTNSIDVVSFNIPFPPNYGGVIDVYFKLLNLKEKGYKINFHSFLYDRHASPELENICNKVFYYKRKPSLFSNFHFIPYIVFSRRSKDLLHNLNLSKGAILFEGLHSCYYLNHKSLSGRNRIVRTHNIEHHYYFHLFKAEKNPKKKLFFLVETIKLKLYQRVLRKANSIAAISLNDKVYFESLNKQTFILQAFHSNTRLISQAGKGDYYLYHANLEVPENQKAIWFLIANVFSKLDFKFVIAGKNPDSTLKEYVLGHSNIILVENPSEQEMNRLISEAHATILFTQQSTGVKLKLLESLFKGRFCIANSKMTAGTELEKVCLKANTASEYITQIKKIDDQEFTNSDLKQRKLHLEKYLPDNNIADLINRL